MMVEFDIWAPRWRDRTILLAAWRIGEKNKVVMKDTKNFPVPLYITGEKASTYPTEEKVAKNGHRFKVRAIPIDDFSTEAL
jgi:kynureninase